MKLLSPRQVCRSVPTQRAYFSTSYAPRGSFGGIFTDVNDLIRHYWEGPVACKSPLYGRWGGPPNGGSNRPAPALDLASAPRGKVSLASVVKSPVPALGLTGKPRKLRPGEAPSQP